MKSCIGKIIKPQGIKGEVKVKPFCDVDAVWFYIAKKVVQVGDSEFVVQSCDMRFGWAYIKFEGINTRNDCENLRDKNIYIEKDIINKLLGKDKFLIEDIIGLKVIADDETYLGQVVDVQNYGSADIFVIENCGRMVSVPYLSTIFDVKTDKIIAKRSEYEKHKVD